MSISRSGTAPRARIGPQGTPGAGVAVTYVPPPAPVPGPPDPPYYGPRNSLDPPYPGPPGTAGTINTWDPAVSETIFVSILRNDVTNTVWFFTSPPFYSGQLTTVWPIPINTYYFVPLDSDLDDPLGMHTNVAQPEFIYPPYQGWYLIFGLMTYDSTTTGQLFDASIAVTQNGVSTVWVGQQAPTQSGTRPFDMVVELQQFNPATTDTIGIAGFETAGTVNTYTAAGQRPYLNILWTVPSAAPANWSTSLPVPANTAFADTTQITGTFLNTNIRDTVNFLTYPPVARLQRTTNVQLASTVFPAGTAVPFTTATLDNWSGWNGTTRYTFPRAGLYLVYGQVNYLNDTTGTDRACGLRVNGGTTQWGSTESSANNTLGHISIACQLIRASATDYVEVIGYSNATTGGGITIGGVGAGTSKMIVMWMAA
jgi:hypothetical protein